MALLMNFYGRIQRAISKSKNEIDMNKNDYTFKLYKFDEIFPLNSDQREIPHPRSGHRIGCNSTNLYVYGGYTPQYVDPTSGMLRQHLFNELWQFNFATRKWMLLPGQETIPPELASVALIFDGKTLMVYGGTNLPFGEQPSNKLYFCVLTKGHFYHGMQLVDADGNMPPPMYGQALVYHDGYLYVIGGTTGYDYTCDIHRINLTTLKWEDVFIDTGGLDYMPAGRYRHEIAFDGVRIYILGGGTNLNAFDLEYLPTFNIKDKVWEKKCTKRDPSDTSTGFPEPRMCHSCVQYKDDNDETYVFIIGGNNGPDIVYNEMWRLQLSNLQWTRISNKPLPFPVYFNSACVTKEGKMYMFGGINRNELKRTNYLHSAWIVIPKLSEMCWESLLHYCPNLSKAPKPVLLNTGIPAHFIDRLYNNLC